MGASSAERRVSGRFCHLCLLSPSLSLYHRSKSKSSRARARESERKREAHRLILLGAMLKDRIARGKVSEKLILADMDHFLTRDHERALFELPPRPNREKGDPQA